MTRRANLGTIGMIAVALVAGSVVLVSCDQQGSGSDNVATSSTRSSGTTPTATDPTAAKIATPPKAPDAKTPAVPEQPVSTPAKPPLRRRSWPAAGVVGWVKVHVSITAGAQNRVERSAYQPADMSASPECAQLSVGRPGLQRMTVGENGVLKDVVVYVTKGLDRFKIPAASGVMRLDLLRCYSRPRVFGIQAGERLLVRNRDFVAHSVRANGGGAAFEIRLDPRGEQVAESVFTEPELGVILQSDIYPWMRSFAVILDHPCYGVTTAKGLAEFDCPAGDFWVACWHEPVPGLVNPKPKKIEVRPNRPPNRVASLMVFKYE